ncbi:MAG: hypothetical protein ACI9EF_002926 [Pseudohongiellaceae bacterium]|jgi:hypothetical protein
MHYLTRQRLHLSLFHPLMKVLMTLYILSVGAGLYVASLKYTDRAEYTTEGMKTWVHGSGEVSADEELGDPFAELEGYAPEGYSEGMSRRELIDIVHPHLFTIPIVLFLLGHLLHLTRLPDWLKLTINVGAFASFGATFLLPFLIIEDATLAPLLYASSVSMLITFVALCVVPLWEMWLGKPGQGFNAIPRRSEPQP